MNARPSSAWRWPRRHASRRARNSSNTTSTPPLTRPWELSRPQPTPVHPFRLRIHRPARLLRQRRARPAARHLLPFRQALKRPAEGLTHRAAFAGEGGPFVYTYRRPSHAHARNGRLRGGLMSTEVIFALVLSSLFLGALAWLVIYSRLQNRKAERSESSPSPVAREAAEVEAPREAVPSRAARR